MVVMLTMMNKITLCLGGHNDDDDDGERGGGCGNVDNDEQDHLVPVMMMMEVVVMLTMMSKITLCLGGMRIQLPGYLWLCTADTCFCH